MTPPLTVSELERVLAPLDTAAPLPSRAFTDDAVLSFERSAIFDRAWTCVGREDEIAHPGAWLRTPLGFGRVVVMRGVDLELRAFFDVCRHRAMPLLEGDQGRMETLTCPYHGWTYDSCGALREAPDTPDDFDRSEHGLRRARVATWGGFLFVTLDANAPTLPESLGEIPPWLSRVHLSTLVRGRRTRWEVAANWKLLVENFQEAHHFPRVHPGLEHVTPAARSSSITGDGPWLGGVMELVAGMQTVSLDGSRHDRPFIVPPEDRRLVHDAMLFPTLLTSLQPDYFLTYRLWPLASDRTEVTADVLFHPSAHQEGVDPRDPCDVYDFWDRVNAEDRSVCERQQLGMRSGGWQPSRYARVEDGMHAFDRLVARAYLRGAP